VPRRQASPRSSSHSTPSFSAGANTTSTRRTCPSPWASGCKSARPTLSSWDDNRTAASRRARTNAPRFRSTWTRSGRVSRRETSRRVRRSRSASGGWKRSTRASFARGKTSRSCARLGRPHCAQRRPVGPGRLQRDGRPRGRHCRVEPRHVPSRLFKALWLMSIASFFFFSSFSGRWTIGRWCHWFV